jgi:hypothetical protein
MLKSGNEKYLMQHCATIFIAASVTLSTVKQCAFPMPLSHFSLFGSAAFTLRAVCYLVYFEVIPY